MPSLSISLVKIRGVAMKHPGMWQDFESAGTVRGDQLEVSREAFEAINAKYFTGITAGAVLHAVLNPIAAVVDAVLGTGLANCGECAGRELQVSDAVESVLTGIGDRLTGRGS